VHGSTVDRIPLEQMPGFPIRVPVDLSEQRAIAHILGTLDDKIELNRRMSETLEAMARALFKSWFVDFLPVRAKMAAKEREPSLLLPQAEPNTWYVYAIECNDGSLYIGQTEDLRQRWLQHVGGKGASWTKQHPPVQVPYWEKQPSREAAVKRENWLKTGYGRKWLKHEIAARTQTGDPVRAKMEGRDPGLPQPLADLFPDSFEDSELGEIPKGWEVGCVDDEFDLTMGQSPPGHTYNEIGDGVPFYQGRTDFGFRFPTRRVYCTAPTRLAKKGDTLISVRAPVGDINMAAEDCAIGRGVAAARHKTGSRSYSYQFMRAQADVFDRFEAEGTVFGAIGKKDFHAIACVVPPRGLVEEFERRVAPLDDRIEVTDQDSRTLAALRDALLPKLISGELRVKDAERFMESAV
jgi:type I restriction enzyme S subunit